MQTTVLHLRITPDETCVLDKVRGKSLSRQSLAVTLMTAAIQALEENDCRLHLPLKFTIQEPQTKPKK